MKKFAIKSSVGDLLHTVVAKRQSFDVIDRAYIFLNEENEVIARFIPLAGAVIYIVSE